MSAGYVDELLIASASEKKIEKVFENLKVEFGLISLGPVFHFLGVEVKRE